MDNIKNETYIGEIVLKNNKVYIRPFKDIKYSLIYTGDSSELLGGYKVEFELSNKVSEYVYDCNILKVLDIEDKPKMMMKSYNTNQNRKQ